MAGMVTKSNVEALLETKVAKDIIEGIVAGSAALSAFTRLPNMSSKKTKMRVLDSLPLAYWVNNKQNNGRKNVTRASWDNKFITAEEIAVIVPIKEELIDDLRDGSNIDLWGELKPRIIEAFHRKIDGAIFSNDDKPESWRNGLVASAIDAGMVVKPASSQTMYSAISDAMTLVEESGYNVTAFLGGPEMKGKFRMMLDTTNQPIKGTEIGEMKRFVVNNGTWDKTLAQMIVGDFSQAVYSIRQDITYKMLDQAIIQDPTDGSILYNLAQEDMVALRVVMRLGWEIPNPINALSPDESTRFPFAVVAPTSGTAMKQNTVTITVTDGEGTAVKGAKVTFAGMSRKTNASGVAEFKTPNGDYEYTVKAEGHNTVTKYITVDGAASESVILD